MGHGCSAPLKDVEIDSVMKLPGIADNIPSFREFETRSNRYECRQTLYVLVGIHKSSGKLWMDDQNRAIIYIGETERDPSIRLREEQSGSKKQTPGFIENQMLLYGSDFLFVPWFYCGKLLKKAQTKYLENILQDQTTRREEAAKLGYNQGFPDLSWHCDANKLIEILLPTLEAYKKNNPNPKFYIQSCREDGTVLLKNAHHLLWKNWCNNGHVKLDYGTTCTLPNYFNFHAPIVNFGGEENKGQDEDEDGDEEEEAVDEGEGKGAVVDDGEKAEEEDESVDSLSEMFGHFADNFKNST